MQRELSSGKVYRFHDKAALHATGNDLQGSTTYLTAKEARAFGWALIKVARSIESEPYGTSRVGSIEIKPQPDKETTP